MPAPSFRKQPTRSVRSTAARPDNYYAKPFSYRSTNPGAGNNEPPAPVTPGFFPAITHFTDAISALPRAVQRHFTLLKETEGKAYQPDQAIAELITAIQKLPEPPRGLPQERQQQYLQMSMGPSLNGSVNGSVVDGHIPFQPQVVPSAHGDVQDAGAVDEHQERRLDLYSNLRDRVREMTMVLDEKNMVLTAANETLTRQLFRLDSSYPSVANEVSEDARLGSNTHWALPSMKDTRRTTGGPTSERTRRDVTNVNNLAAAAAAVHEGEIAATRSEARREAMLAKRGRAHNFDSDFDDRAPVRKQPGTTKGRKVPDVAVSGTNGNGSHKRRRVEKVKGPPVERSIGAALNGRLGAGRASPRDTPVAEAVGRKKAKPLPVPVLSRKKNLPVNSPSITSSPSQATFPPIRAQSPAAINHRSAAARSRMSSNASLLQETSRKRPASAQSSRSKHQISTLASNKSHPITTQAVEADNVGGDAGMLPDREEEGPGNDRDDADIAGLDGADSVKRERTEPPDPSYAASQPLPPVSAKPLTSQSGSKTSKPATPTHNIFTETPMTGMSRSRSTRGINNSGPATTNGSPKLPPSAPSPRRSHKKGASQSSIHTEGITRPAAVAAQDEGNTSRRPKRNDARKTHVETDAYDEEVNDAVAEDTPYCFCKKPSEGEMIGCDNEDCPTEWFHMDCVGLSRAPVDEWFCTDTCRKHQHAKAADV